MAPRDFTSYLDGDTSLDDVLKPSTTAKPRDFTDFLDGDKPAADFFKPAEPAKTEISPDEAPAEPPAEPVTPDTWADLGRKLTVSVVANARQTAAGALERTGADPYTEFATQNGISPNDPMFDGPRQRWNDIQEQAVNSPAKIGKAMYAAAEKDLKDNAPTSGFWTAKGAVYNMTNLVAQMVPSIVAGILTKSAPVGLGVMGEGVGAQQYGSAKAEGQTPEQAEGEASFYQLAETLTEIPFFGNLLKEGKHFFPELVKSMGFEGFGEGINQAVEQAYEAAKQSHNEGISFADAWTKQGGWGAVVQASALGAGAGGMFHAAAHGTEAVASRGGVGREIYNEVNDANFTDAGVLNETMARMDPSGRFPARSSIDDAETPAPAPGGGPFADATQDPASAIPKDVLDEGNAEVHAALEEEHHNANLDAYGLPAIGSRVTVDFGDGRVESGQLAGGFHASSPELGVEGQGVRVHLDSGQKVEELLSTLTRFGITITPEIQQAAEGAQAAADGQSSPGSDGEPGAGDQAGPPRPGQEASPAAGSSPAPAAPTAQGSNTVPAGAQPAPGQPSAGQQAGTQQAAPPVVETTARTRKPKRPLSGQGGADLITFLASHGGISADEGDDVHDFQKMTSYGPLVRKGGMPMDGNGGVAQLMQEHGYLPGGSNEQTDEQRPYDVEEAKRLIQRARTQKVYVPEKQGEIEAKNQAERAKLEEKAARKEIQAEADRMGIAFPESEIESILQIMAERHVSASDAVDLHADSHAVETITELGKEDRDGEGAADIPFDLEPAEDRRPGGAHEQEQEDQANQPAEAGARGEEPAGAAQGAQQGLEPATEQIDTVDGKRDQGIVAGAEQSTEQAAAKKTAEQKAAEDKARLKGKQTKMRAGKAQEEAGGMFAPEQKDLLSAPAKSTPEGKEGQESRSPSPPSASDYGAKNKLVTKDRAAELAAKMAAKFKGQLNTGIDPEMVAMGTELAVYHIEAGTRKFIDVAKALYEQMKAAGVAWAQMRPYLRSWYNGARDLMEDSGGDIAGMDSPEDVKAALKEMTNAPDRSSGVEQDRSDAEAQDELGASDVQPQRGGAAPGAREGKQPTGEAGNKLPGRKGLVSGTGAAPLGERGDQQIREGEPVVSERATERGGPVGSGGDRVPGPGDERVPEKTIAAASPAPTDLKTARAAQVAAKDVKVVPADRANIDKTLPFLKPAQRDDVLKAENRFYSPDGHGFLFTNGTGTGKTYVGAGVIARFYRQGDQNIIVAVPSQDIAKNWVEALANLDVPASILDSTETAGKGVVVTTFANLDQNRHLADRAWDLSVADESQKLMSNEAGETTGALATFRAITNHPDGRYDRARMQLREEGDKLDAARDERGKRPPSNEEEKAIRDYLEKAKALAAKMADEPRGKALFLSATPFAYVKNIDYGQGYLFDWHKGAGDDNRQGYNAGDNRERFYMQHFGYRMRYNKLTQPDAKVDTSVLEREFHEWLKREGSLSGRRLDVPFDYDRKFVLVDDGIGTQIDRLLDFINEADDHKFSALSFYLRQSFDYLARVRLLEAIKAHHAIDYIKAQHALGRKVVVFHDYNEGGGVNPFVFPVADEHQAIYDEFHARNPEAMKMDFESMGSPLETLQAAFPQALVYNGTVPNKQRRAAKDLFNVDGNDKNLIIVQSAAGEFGISLHDVTGKHQRALVNLGLPTRPVTAIQEEGRIYREGQASDAVFRYFNTGTNWERFAFATRIAERASTAENLALGNEARALRQSFIDAFLDSAPDEPAAGDGRGGKEADKAANAAISDWDRAKSLYYAQQKLRGNRSQRQGVDYFPTPEPVGLKMVQLADIKLGEKTLEPSAGHGAIARFLPEDSDRTIIEPSNELSSRAAMASPGAKVLTQRFEDLHVNNKYDAIVMNPPYGMGGKAAMEHLALAMTHLRNGGRIVALLPLGEMANRRYMELMTSEAGKDFHLVANIHLPAVTFEKAGTAVNTHIVVLEKQTEAADAAKIQETNRDYSKEPSIEDLFDRMENLEIPPRVEPAVKEAEVPEVDSAGNITLNGNEFAVRYSGGTYSIKPKKFLGPDTFRAAAQAATAAGGEYDRGAKAFTFPDREKRDAWFAAMANPKPAPAAVPGAPAEGGVKMTTAEFAHTQTGAIQYAATIADRVETPVYQAINSLAKKHGGRYSPYRSGGAVAGFLFKSESARSAFLAELATQGKDARAPIFFSALTRAVEAAKQTSASAANWKGIIANAPGIKAEEIEWTGINEWLDMQKGAVSRDAVTEFLRGNGVQVEEVVKGAAGLNFDGDVIVAENGRGEWGVYGQDDSDPIGGSYETREEAEIALEAMKADHPTKFATYVLPGGENYRELLLTLPFKPTDRWSVRRNDNGTYSSYDTTNQNTGGSTYSSEEQARGNAESRNNEPRFATTDNFTTGHYDEPNVLAHIRFNERVDADGKRVLFIEEIQSDWAQKGRKAGFADEARKAELTTARETARVEHLKLREALISSMTKGVYANLGDISRDGNAVLWRRVSTALGDDPQIAGAEKNLDAITRELVKMNSALPSAPFVKDTAAWSGLAMKRMIRWAAENGFERIAWTTGDQQNDRYDLSKRVGEIYAEKEGDGYLLTVTDKDGENIYDSRKASPAEDLPDIVGKDMADKIVGDLQNEKSKTYSGLDLKVGGEGMRGFYDKILPTVANKIGKKFGAKVGATQIGTAQFTYRADDSADEGSSYTVYQADGQARAFVGSEQEARNYIDGETERADQETAVHSLDITEPMRESVLQGQSLFRQPDAAQQQQAAPQIDQAALEARLKEVGISDKVVGKIVKAFASGAHGRYVMRMIQISQQAPDQRWVLNHEIIHAFRDLGLFTEMEWLKLKNTALANKSIMDSVRERYPDLSEEEQLEEAVADMFAYWKAGQPVPTKLGALWNKVVAFFKAIGAAVRGGYANAEDTFKGIDSGFLAARPAWATAGAIDEPGPMGISPKFMAGEPPAKKGPLDETADSQNKPAVPARVDSERVEGAGTAQMEGAQGVRGVSPETAYDSADAIAAAVADGSLAPVEKNTGYCYPLAGQKALDLDATFVIGVAGPNEIWHALAATGGDKVYDPQYERWFTIEAYREAMGGFTPVEWMDAHDLRAYGRKNGKWPGPAALGLVKPTAKEARARPAGAVTPTVAFDDPNTEARYQGARSGVKVPTTWAEKLVDKYTEVREGFTRHFIHLPNEVRFADVREQLRKLEAAPQASKESIVRILHDLTKGMTAADLDLFTRKVILDDLSWEVQQDRALAFGFTPETVRSELAKIDAVLNDRPDLVDKIRNRKIVTAEIAQQLVEHGILSADQIQNPSYYRHVVLDYARAEVAKARGPGKQVRTPFWAKRMGSTLDINANLLEAEFDWLHKAFMDISTAKTLAWVRDSALNVRAATIERARQHNNAQIESLIDADKQVNGFMRGVTLTSPMNEEWIDFKRRIAIGLANIQKLAENGQIDNVPAEYRDVLDNLAHDQAHDDGNLFNFLTWMLDNKKAGWESAGMIYKSISARRDWMQRILGRRFANTRDMNSLIGLGLAPEGHVAWQPNAPDANGKALTIFTAKSITEHAADRIVNALLADPHLPGPLAQFEATAFRAQVKDALMVGGPRFQMILPQELADTLSNFRDRHAEGLFDALASPAVSAWKIWELINPRRWAKYNINNLSGDLDAVIAGNPRALRQLPKAIGEIYRVMFKHEAPSQAYRDAVERGVFDSGFTIQEVPDINELTQFARLLEKPGLLEAPGKFTWRQVLKVWSGLKVSTQFRENWLRYSAYLDYLERINAGETMDKIGYGAALPEMVDAITDNKDRAALLARELVGDYGNVSHYGQIIRRTVVPFYSWMEINTRRYWRLMGNAWGDGIGRGLATTGYLGATLGVKTTAKLYARMVLISALVMLWNNLLFGDDEDKLEDIQRAQLHINLGTWGGEIHTLRFQGALSDFLGWIGFPDVVGALSEVYKGRANIAEVLETIAAAPVRKLAGTLTPLITVPVEMLSGKKYWPDVFEPRQIRDKWREIAATFSLENEYDTIFNKPTRGLKNSAENALFYSQDVGETAYNRIRGLTFDYLKRVKGEEGVSASITPRSTALYDWKRAQRYGDKDAEREAYQKMRSLGMTYEDRRASILRSAPLGALSIIDRARFRRTLTSRERDALAQAQTWYEETFHPGEAKDE